MIYDSDSICNNLFSEKDKNHISITYWATTYIYLKHFKSDENTLFCLNFSLNNFECLIYFLFEISLLKLLKRLSVLYNFKKIKFNSTKDILLLSDMYGMSECLQMQLYRHQRTTWSRGYSRHGGPSR